MRDLNSDCVRWKVHYFYSTLLNHKRTSNQRPQQGAPRGGLEYTPYTNLNDSFEGLMTLLVGPGLLEAPPDANVLPEEDLAVVLKPVQDLLDVLLE